MAFPKQEETCRLCTSFPGLSKEDGREIPKLTLGILKQCSGFEHFKNFNNQILKGRKNKQNIFKQK